MKLYIPGIGDIIKLTKEWTFEIEEERRNYIFLTKFFPEKKDEFERYPIFNKRHICLISLPPETELKIDRLYIRNGLSGFNSVTFKIVEVPIELSHLKKKRFWAGLKFVNQIEFEQK